jgi:proteasome component ECM29
MRSLTKTVLSHLEEIQMVFISILSYPKSKQFIRECCCIGLVACRGLLHINQTGDVNMTQSLDEMNSRLLRAFGQTTQYGGSAFMESEEQAAMRRRNDGSSLSANIENDLREIGGAPGIGEAALGAYREMAAASVLLGRHDVFYSLLLLSVSHPYWSSAEASHLYR